MTGGIKLQPTHIAVSGADTEGRGFDVSATKVDETCVDYSVTAVEVRDGGAPDEVAMSGRACAADITEAFEGSDVPVEVQAIAERLVGQLGQLGVVTVEVDGRWYVSPSRTLTDVLLVAHARPRGRRHRDAVGLRRLVVDVSSPTTRQLIAEPTGNRGQWGADHRGTPVAPLTEEMLRGRWGRGFARPTGRPATSSPSELASDGESRISAAGVRGRRAPP